MSGATAVTVTEPSPAPLKTLFKMYCKMAEVPASARALLIPLSRFGVVDIRPMKELWAAASARPGAQPVAAPRPLQCGRYGSEFRRALAEAAGSDAVTRFFLPFGNPESAEPIFPGGSSRRLYAGDLPPTRAWS